MRFDAFLTGITEPFSGKMLDLNWNGTMIDGVRHFAITDYRIALVILPAYLLTAAFVIAFFTRHVMNISIETGFLTLQSNNLRSINL